MPTLALPTSQAPPFVLLALVLLQNAEIKWDAELSDITFEGKKGANDVREILEDGIPGKEVRILSCFQMMLIPDCRSHYHLCQRYLSPLARFRTYRASLMPLMTISRIGESPVKSNDMCLTLRRTYFAGPRFGFGDCVIWGTIRCW